VKVSENGIRLIKNFEGLRLTGYLCSAQKPTIGYGYTGLVGGKEIIDKVTKITKEQAEQFFAEDIKEVEEVINRNVKVPLTQNQFDALASWVFNFGETNLKDSTLLRRLNCGYYDQAAKQFKLWNKIYDSKRGIYIESPGLTERRLKEMGLFLKNG
jgi:lysozyme